MNIIPFQDDDYPWYTIEQLYVCWYYRDLKHGRYLEKVKEKYGPQKSKRLFIYHRDRDGLLKYLEPNGPKPDNVAPRTRRDLNPEQVSAYQRNFQ